jgi:hypothetical protein
MPGESNPPRHLEDGVEPMLDLACPICLYFQARLFAIEAVEHPDDESERKSPTEPTLLRRELWLPTQQCCTTTLADLA